MSAGWDELSKYSPISPAIYQDPFKSIKELADMGKEIKPEEFQKSMFPGVKDEK